MKLVSSLFKEDPVQKQLRKLNISTQTLALQVVGQGIKFYLQRRQAQQQQGFIKTVIKMLQQKGSFAKKIKVMMVLLEISKISKYDICDIILNKKIKVFTKATKLKHNQIEPRPENLQEFIYEQLIMPLYNYLMKISTNEELYHTCQQGQIPSDQIFRRGTKIRFIWIFKVYNIMSILIPILNSLIRLHQLNPTLVFFNETISILFNDLALMNNFVTKALQQASMDNYMLMPYFDMLQFHESMVEQKKVGKEIENIYNTVKNYTQQLVKPVRITITAEELQEIQIQALRVKLISNSLKNPKKDHGRLQTQYNQKIQKRQRTLENYQTEPAYREESEDFKQKWRNLD